MKSEWKVIYNQGLSYEIWEVVRIIDTRKPVHAGNLESDGIIYRDEASAQVAADLLNESAY